MADIRTFIAIKLPGVAAQLVADMTQRMQFMGDKVRWVREDGVHLTLKFLGDVPEETVPDVVKIVQRTVQGRKPMTLSLAGLGGFASLDNARVIWLGVQGDVDALGTLQAEMDLHLESLGFAREKRKYFPHITLGRARRQSVAVDVSRVGAFQPVYFRADCVTIFKSDLQPQGAVYTPLGYGLLSG